MNEIFFRHLKVNVSSCFKLAILPYLLLVARPASVNKLYRSPVAPAGIAYPSYEWQTKLLCVPNTKSILGWPLSYQCPVFWNAGNKLPST